MKGLFFKLRSIFQKPHPFGRMNDGSLIVRDEDLHKYSGCGLTTEELVEQVKKDRGIT